jgi:hypothetical protein
MSAVADKDVSNADIMRAIGEVIGEMKGIRREQDNAANGRKTLYERIEATGAELSNLRFENEKQTGINAQIREEIKALHTAQASAQEQITPLLDLKDALPGMVETWRDMNKWSKRLVYLLGIGGVSVVGVVIWFGGLITQAFKNWLGLPPG